MSVLIIRPPGDPLPKASKYASESIEYILDCKSLLDFSELVIKGKVINPVPSLSVLNLKSYEGTGLICRIENRPITTAMYVDHMVSIEFITTLNNLRMAQFSIRVHK